MKNIVLIVVLLISTTVFSQENEADKDIPFVKIENVPVFPGCENVEEDQKRNCFQEKMQEHIRENFKYPKKAVKKKISGKVFVIFTIDKDGSIINIVTRGPHKLLEKEAVRIIKKLPKMQPGKHKGKPVRVPFAIPLTFKL